MIWTARRPLSASRRPATSIRGPAKTSPWASTGRLKGSLRDGWTRRRSERTAGSRTSRRSASAARRTRKGRRTTLRCSGPGDEASTATLFPSRKRKRRTFCKRRPSLTLPARKTLRPGRFLRPEHQDRDIHLMLNPASGRAHQEIRQEAMAVRGHGDQAAALLAYPLHDLGDWLSISKVRLD